MSRVSVVVSIEYHILNVPYRYKLRSGDLGGQYCGPNPHYGSIDERNDDLRVLCFFSEGVK